MACLGKPEVNCVSVGLFETARLLLLRFEDTFTAVLFISLKVTTCENYSQRKKQRNECNFSKPRRRNYQVYSNLIGTCNGTDRVPYCFHPGAELGSARGATAPQKFCHCPPKILSSQCHPQNFPLDVMPLHWSPTQTTDSSPCCKTGPSSGPPNENVWLRPSFHPPSLTEYHIALTEYHIASIHPHSSEPALNRLQPNTTEIIEPWHQYNN